MESGETVPPFRSTKLLTVLLLKVTALRSAKVRPVQFAVVVSHRLSMVAPQVLATTVTEIFGEVFAVFKGSVTSEAVRACGPGVLNVTGSTTVPASRGVSAGKVARPSVEVMATVSVTVSMRFQNSSTAFTVTPNATPTGRSVGVPVLPVTVPGTAVSPGASSCSLEKAPAVVVMLKGMGVVTRPALATMSAVWAFLLRALMTWTPAVRVPLLSPNVPSAFQSNSMRLSEEGLPKVMTLVSSVTVLLLLS